MKENQRQAEYVGGCRFGSLAGQLVESDDDTRADLAQRFVRWLELFRDGLRAMRDRGDLNAVLAHVESLAVDR